jgi:hypothetical protein
MTFGLICIGHADVRKSELRVRHAFALGSNIPNIRFTLSSASLVTSR